MGARPTQRKLDKIKREIASARRAIHNITGRDLRGIAARLGRKRDTSRGKEPTFVSTLFEANPISIPDDVKGDGTKRNILDDLESDVFLLEMELEAEGYDDYGDD
jgi:hypothetical protein